MKFFVIIVLLFYILDITGTSRLRRQPQMTSIIPTNRTTKRRTSTTTTPVPDPRSNKYLEYYALLDWCEERITEVLPDHKSWRVDTVDLGITEAGYNLTGYYIKFSQGQKTIFLEANIHGGETLATGVAVYVFDELLTHNSSSNADVRGAVESFNWLIVPIANPEGYMFKKNDPFMFRKQTWKKTTVNETAKQLSITTKPPLYPRDVAHLNINCRKDTAANNLECALKDRKKRFQFCCWEWLFFGFTTTRRTTTTTPTTPTTTTTLPPRPCIGINANLNFKYKFGSDGTSQDICDQNYAGLAVETEPITKALAQYMIDNNKDIIMYISLHTNESRRIMMPFSNGEPCKNFNLLKDIAQKAGDFVRQKTRAKYDIGNIADLKEASSGHSVDFARITTIKYNFMIETQDNKWLTAPPSLIPKRGKEVMCILYQLCKGILKEESKVPENLKPSPQASHQNNIHPKPILLIPLVLCLIIYQIYNPIFFS